MLLSRASVMDMSTAGNDVCDGDNFLSEICKAEAFPVEGHLPRKQGLRTMHLQCLLQQWAMYKSHITPFPILGDLSVIVKGHYGF